MATKTVHSQLPARILEDRVRALGPWFHNLRLPDSGKANGAVNAGSRDTGNGPYRRRGNSGGDDGGRSDGRTRYVQTAPRHPLGDFPANFWRHFRRVVPQDLSGKTVLDIGCNAGFYSFEMKRRGAAYVLGIDHDPRYLAQAEFARDCLGLEVEFRQMEAYDVDQLGDRKFHLVIFMGVFYHLRHPLYALEKVARLVGERLLFQTMERGLNLEGDFADDYPIDERGVFFDERFPRMYFIEKSYAHDPTNWWIPNPPATAAMLRSVGLRIVDRPCNEVYLCEPAASA